MATILLMHAEIDDSRPLLPQIEAARAAGVPWKVLEEKLGVTGRQMRKWLAGEARASCAVPFFRNDRRSVGRA